ncbi:hypothetical protein Tco_0944133, partial [Tanacetum coccineum]
DNLKIGMEMEIPSTRNVKGITKCSDTTYTCYEVMKDLIKVSKLLQNLISFISSLVHRMAIHYKMMLTIMHTFANDQIDSDIIFDDPYVDNNSGQAEHDTNAHDHSLHDFESLIINIQVEAEKQWKMNIELKRQQALLQRELDTCKERVKEFENKPEQALGYKEAYEKLQNKINVEMEQLFNEKEKIREELLKPQDETLKIKRETNLYKKAFKERENKYLEDIVSLEEKL